MIFFSKIYNHTLQQKIGVQHISWSQGCSVLFLSSAPTPKTTTIGLDTFFFLLCSVFVTPPFLWTVISETWRHILLSSYITCYFPILPHSSMASSITVCKNCTPDCHLNNIYTNNFDKDVKFHENIGHLTSNTIELKHSDCNISSVPGPEWSQLPLSQWWQRELDKSPYCIVPYLYTKLSIYWHLSMCIIVALVLSHLVVRPRLFL